MKTKIKHLSKSTISLLLVLLMVISSVTVGIIATSAAIVDGDGNVGATVDADSSVGAQMDFYLDTTTNWGSATAKYDAWVFGDTITDYWVDFSQVDSTYIWKTSITDEATGVKVYRRSTSSTSHSFGDSDKWNTAEPSGSRGTSNCITITDWNTGVWSTYSTDYYIHLAKGDNNYDDWPATGTLIGTEGADFTIEANQIYCFGINQSSTDKNNLINMPASNDIVKSGDIAFAESNTSLGGGTGAKFRTNSAGTMNIKYDGTTLTLTFNGTPVSDTLVLAGNKALVGEEYKWKNNSAEKPARSDLIKNPDSGVYTWTLNDVAASEDLEFRIVKDGTWTSPTGASSSGNYSFTEDSNTNTGSITKAGSDNIKFAINNRSNITFTYTASTGKTTIKAVNSLVEFDGYYLVGRISKYTDESRATEESAAEGRTDTDGQYYPGKWYFSSNSTNLPFTRDTENTDLYYIDTFKTISELSPLDNTGAFGTGTTGQYFAVYDKNRWWGDEAESQDANNFQNKRDNSNAITTAKTDALNSFGKELMFNDKSSNSDGYVRIWIDVSGVMQNDGTGNMKIWYEVNNETLPIAKSVTLEASPVEQNIGSNISLTARLTDRTAGTSGAELTYTFYDGDTEIGTVTTSENTATLNDITSNFPGVHNYKVVVSTEAKYNKTDDYTGATTLETYRSVQASATAKFKENNLYVTKDITSHLANPYWINKSTQAAGEQIFQIVAKDNNYSAGDITDSGSYEFAMSNSAAYDPNFHEYTIDESLNQYCDITLGTKIVTIDGEEVSIRTYIVKPRKNCKNPVIYFNTAADKRTVYAVAEYVDDTSQNIDTTNKYVTYYFAEPVGDENITNPSSGTGMRIVAWNASYAKGSDAVRDDNKYGPKAYDVTTEVKVNNSNTIYVNVDELYTGNIHNNYKGSQQFKVYSVKLPVQMTSFRFVNYKSSNEPNESLEAEYLWSRNKMEQTGPHSDVLNPNRIYLLFNAHADGDSPVKWYRTVGVILDEHLWTKNTSSSATNQVDTEEVKANLINYKDISSIDNPKSEAVNTSLSSMYNTSGTPYTLYFGNFWDVNSDTGLTGYHKYYNLAQSGKENNTGDGTEDTRMYYSAIQNYVGMTVSSKTNKMGYGYLMDTQSNDGDGVSTAKVNPLFDYDNLVSDGAASLVKQNIDFPMNKATFNGITTYSYDSTTDYNRLYDASDEKFVVQGDKGTSTAGYWGNYAYGQDSDGKNYAGFFPFGGNNDKYSNTGFAAEFDMTFYMTNSGKLKGKDDSEQDIMFSFSGDDDVWVYVDGVKVLDLGGDHKVSAGVINFSEGKVYYKSAAIDAAKVDNNKGIVKNSSDVWAAGNANYIKAVDLVDLLASYGVDFKKNDSSQPHTFQMFYMERGAFQSNCAISYNLPMASGLNIKNVVTTDNVNPGLVEATLKSANKDYFNYSIQEKITSTADYEVLRNKYSTATEYNSTFSEGIDLNSPLYPYWYETKREVTYNDAALSDDTYKLSASGTQPPSGDDSKSQNNSYNNSEFKNVARNVYTIGDTNLVPYTNTVDGETKTYGDVTGRTDDIGQFHLLYGQTAKFENKIDPYSLISIKQTQNLGTVTTTTGDVLSYAATNYKTGDYYLTSYSIYDERSMSYIVKPQAVKAQNTADILAYDTTNTATNPDSGTKSFYFANYKTNNHSNPSMTVTFTNDVAVGTLRVQKAVDGVAKPGDKFRFKVYFANVFGDTRQTTYREMPDLVYYIYNAGGSLAKTTPYTYGSGILLEAGQYAEIKGVPVETAYQVCEVTKSGYTLKEINKTVVKPNNAAVDTTSLSIDLADTAKFTDDPTTGAKVTRDAAKFYNEKFDPRDVTIDNLPTDCAGGTTKAKYEAGTNLTYYVNMIPTITETLVDDFRNYVSVSNVKFTNECESFKVRIRYYDRNQVEGSYAQINPEGTYFDVKINNYTDYIVSDEDGNLVSINFQKMIQSALTNFVLSDIITNEVDDYIAWSSQADAVGDSGIKTYTNAKTGETYMSTQYHTDYISQPQSSGQKWVNYFTDTTESESLDEDAITTPAQYGSIKGITVWCFNTPKTYNVNVHYAKSDAELSDDSTKNINGTNVTINVAKGDKKTYSFYYNQRFGKVSPDPKANEVGFMEQYDKVGYTNYFPNNPDDFESEIGDKKFIYWAYDAAGQQVASTDPLYAYRVTKPFDLYAVYGSEVLSEDVYGLTIFDNATESYVEDGPDGVPVKKTRINTIFNAYNLVDFDPKLRRPALINIFLSKQIRQDPTYWTDARINELFEKYKGQLKTLLSDKGGVSYFKQNQTFSTDVTEFNLTLTTYGYVYAAEKSIDTGVVGLTTATLTNKNRMQFVTKYTTKDLHPDYTDDDKNNKGYLNKNVCFISVGAMYYGTSDSSEWIISDNCLIRRFDSVDVTTTKP